MSSKIIVGYPPNYDEICNKIPSVRKNKGAVFSYGSIIYNPSGITLPPDLLIHELAHASRQKNDINDWWNKYLNDKKFRLDEELVAYATQYRYIKNNYGRSARRKLLNSFASILSSDFYGHVIDKKTAENTIELLSNQKVRDNE